MKKVICLLLTILISSPAWATPFAWGSNYQGGEPAGGGTPGGSDTQVQFNDGGSFGGDEHFTYDKTNDVLHVHKQAGDATDGLILEAANGTDVGILGAANTANATWYGTHNYNNGGTLTHQIATSGVVFNEPGSDVDFRVESDNEPNMFVVDAGTDQILFGNSTTSITRTGTVTAQSFKTTVTTSPSTPNTSSMAFDSDAWATGRGAYQVHDGTATTRLLATLASDTPTNGQIPQWNTGGTITWETPSAGGIVGSTGSQDNRIIRADGTGGSTVQSSSAYIEDSGDLVLYDGSGESPKLMLRPEAGDSAQLYDAYASQGVYVGYGNSTDNKTLYVVTTGSGVMNAQIEGDLYSGSNLGGRWNIDGTSDEIQMWIQAHSTQTNNVVLIEKSDGTDILTVANTGSMKLVPVASPPGSPASGDIYVDSTPAPDELCFYDGSAWQGISSGTDANCA